MAGGRRLLTGPPVLRRAGEGDLVALRDLEREAGLAALAHVFPPDRYPYPSDAVLARWRIVLDDPDCTTYVIDGVPGVLDGLVTVDAVSVRHLAVRPERWGSGFARRLMETACADLTGTPYLWCLVDNQRARGCYERLGWTPTTARREAEWPPHPLEMAYQLRRDRSPHGTVDGP